MRTALACIYGAMAVLAAIVAGDSIDAQVKALVDTLTVDQLLAQMNQIDINSFKASDDDGNIIVNLTVVEGYANMTIGSYLNSPFGDPRGTKYNLNATEYRVQLNKMQALHLKYSKIPFIHGIDSVHGANYVYNATLFPQSINTGATFNTTLARLAGLYTGRDTKAAGIPWVFGPMMEPVRHKHWSRIYESFNEDPAAVASLAAAYIEGMQSQKVAACIKHLIAYSDPIDGNDRSNVNESTYELLNYFVPPFKAAVDVGVLSVMGSYISLNGVPVSANSVTSRDLLRHDLNFTGVLVSDYGEIYLLRRDHKVVSTDLDAVDLCMNKTSYDMSMVPWDTSFIDYGKQLIAQNRLTVDRIKESAARILKLKFQLDLFQTPLPGAELVAQVGDADSVNAALATAQESIVLLKNDNSVLPLSTSTKVFFTGSSMDNIGYLCGGWTLYWQGVSGSHVFPHGKSILKAINDSYVPNATYYQGINIDGNYTLPNGTAVSAVIDEVLAAAKDATVTVVALGEYPYAEDAGNGTPQPLPSEFVTYLKTLKATGTKIVLVLVEGRPRTLNGLADLADAVLWAGLPCELGGRAIADVLFGKVNPSGKLPYTYPKTAEFINLATPYYQRNSTTCFKNQTTTPCEAEFPYGYGLSYTTFAYSSARINTTTLNFQQKTGVRITVNVKNTGTVAGKETVMLFLTPPPRANAETKLLKKFTKINLQPNEATDVVFDLLPDDWGYYAGEIGQGLVKSAPSGLYVFAFKATTDCAVNPKDALCLTLQWTNTDNAPVTADKKSTDGGSSSPSSSKSGSAVTSVSVASLVLALVSLIQL
ncbi:hypothetical protein LEN26_009037 [Aphanomyces euteiches]|nr:hypothetical protein LEN26_009037 [Aphanomyces euteiches]